MINIELNKNKKIKNNFKKIIFFILNGPIGIILIAFFLLSIVIFISNIFGIHIQEVSFSMIYLIIVLFGFWFFISGNKKKKKKKNNFFIGVIIIIIGSYLFYDLNFTQTKFINIFCEQIFWNGDDRDRLSDKYWCIKSKDKFFSKKDRIYFNSIYMLDTNCSYRLKVDNKMYEVYEKEKIKCKKK